MVQTLRRPGGYIAALLVANVAVLTGLPWWAGVVAAALALILGAVVASVAAGVAESTGRPVAASTPRIEAIGPNVATLRLEGEFWTLAFRGPAFRLRDSKGLRYIHRLLQEPGREVHALELVLLGQAPSDTVVVPAHEDIHAGGPSDQPVLDRQARQSFRARIEDLEDQIEEAEANNDPERAARARDEVEFILDEIDRATTPSGSRRFPAEAERARLNVTRAIRSAISKVRAQDASLAHHLDHNIRTGTYCSYEPDLADALTWTL
jgi:hypothetical protein